MELVFTRQEKELLNRVLHEKQVGRHDLLAQTMVLIAGGILLVAPVVFMIRNIGDADRIVQTAGVYLGIMMLLGMALCFYSVFSAHARKNEKERETLISALKKLCESTHVNLD